MWALSADLLDAEGRQAMAAFGAFDDPSLVAGERKNRGQVLHAKGLDGGLPDSVKGLEVLPRLPLDVFHAALHHKVGSASRA